MGSIRKFTLYWFVVMVTITVAISACGLSPEDMEVTAAVQTAATPSPAPTTTKTPIPTDTSTPTPVSPPTSSPSSVSAEHYHDFFPTWSPDGSRIAFVSDRDGDPDIYLMDADGSNVVQLTLDQSVSYDLLSPEGYFHRALGNIARGELEVAVADLDEAITLDSLYAEAYLARGVIYGYSISPLVDAAKAIPDLQSALRLGLDPDLAPIVDVLLETLQAME